MPVPATIDDLSTTAASNFPAGGESPNTSDDYLRAHAAFIAELRDDKVEATESTFTPALTFGGGSTGLTYTSRTGRYIQLEKRIFFQIRIELSAKGSSTGSVSITGLPTASMATTTQSVNVFYRSGFTGLTGAGAGVIDVSTTAIILYHGSTTGASLMTNSEFSNSSIVYVQGFYEVA